MERDHLGLFTDVLFLCCLMMMKMVYVPALSSEMK